MDTQKASLMADPVKLVLMIYTDVTTHLSDDACNIQ